MKLPIIAIFAYAAAVLTGCDRVKLGNSVNFTKESFFVSSVSPEQGPPGTEISIAGAGFSDLTIVKFSGVTLPAISKEKDKIRIVVPDSSPGINTIAVEDQGSATNIIFVVTGTDEPEKTNDPVVAGEPANQNPDREEAANSVPGELPKDLADKYIDIEKLEIGNFEIKNPIATISDNTPEIEWQGTVNAAGFTLKITSDALCMTAIRTYSGLTNTEKIVTDPLTDGSYFICVEAYNAAGATKKAKNNGIAITIDTMIPFAVLSGAPPALNNSTNHSISVSGTGVQTYVYKFGPTQFVLCDQTFGYSAFVNVTNPLTLDQTINPDGDYKICVLGVSANGIIQPATQATIATWKKDTTTPPVLLGFNQQLPYKIGGIKLSVSLPINVADYFELKIYVANGIAPPNCSGTLAFSTTNFSSDPVVEMAWDLLDTAKSFRACISDRAGNMQSSNILSNATGQHQRIFVSSATFDGNLKASYQNTTFQSGREGASYRCQYLADQAGLDGTFEALLGRVVYKGNGNGSGSSGYPHYDGKTFNMLNDQVVANRKTDFWSAAHQAAITHDENGNDLAASGNLRAWISMSSAGIPYGSDCSDWTNQSTGIGYIGFIDQPNFKWASGYEVGTDFYYGCNLQARLYCLEVLPKPAGLTAFSTSGSEGAVTITLDFPDNTASFGRVEVIRFAAGESETNIECLSTATGYSLLKTYNGSSTPFTDDVRVDSASFGKVRRFIYQACVYDTFGFLRRIHEISAPVTGGANTDRTAFVTAADYYPNFGGLSGGDSICQAAATAAGLGDNNYRAILSDSSVNAASRIVLAGPVYDTVGRKIADNHADLFDGSLDNSLQFTQFGTYSSYYVRTGSDSVGVSTGLNCNNWTSSTSGFTGTNGYSNYITSAWINYTSYIYNCSYPFRLYCISGQP